MPAFLVVSSRFREWLARRSSNYSIERSRRRDLPITNIRSEQQIRTSYNRKPFLFESMTEQIRAREQRKDEAQRSASSIRFRIVSLSFSLGTGRTNEKHL